MPKNNETFDDTDEWYLMYGPQITTEEAASISILDWRTIKPTIQAARQRMEAENKGGILWKEARHEYLGILWKYQEVIKKFKIKNTETNNTIKSFKKPKL